MNLLTVKIITMLLLGGVSLGLGLFPILLRRCLKRNSTKKQRKTEWFISSLSCFGGGVILTTCLTHMMPEVTFFLNHNIEQGHFPDTGLPIAEILVLCGFFMIYVVEELTHLGIDCFCGGGVISPIISKSNYCFEFT